MLGISPKPELLGGGGGSGSGSGSMSVFLS